jgi:putative addiction module killer protein
MRYFIILKENAKFFLDSLDKSTKSKIENAINKLQEDPFTKGKMLGSLNSGVPFLEKRLFFGPGYRIYYSVLSGRIYIDSVQYAGKVHVLQIGNKKTQKKDILNAKQN